MTSNVIKDVFASTLKRAGFQKKGEGWFKETDDAVLVANLQKSNFGAQYYVNLAIWLKALGEVRFPKEYQCHIRIRASALDPERQKYWNSEVFNLDHDEIPAEERFDLVRSFLEMKAIPFLLAGGSLPELRRLFREGHLKAAAVVVSAQKVLRAE
jgi:hypothetical protein